MKPSAFARSGLALLLLGVAAVLLARAFSRPHIDLNPYQALGAVAAEEAARLCGGSGHVALVVPDSGTDPDPVLEAQLAAFRQSLRKSPNVDIAGVETVKMDPMLRMQTGGAIPPDQFEYIRRKHSSARLLVLFLGFPPIPPEDTESTGKAGPRIMVVSAALPGYEKLLRQGTIQLAIVPRPLSTESPPTPPKSTREAFDLDYVILRPENPGN